METRRENLKIIGAIGITCAFPFSADELYGQQQHVHVPGPAPVAGPFEPKFFTKREVDVVSRIADLIIPTTDTPGAVAAGVPKYIDSIVAASPDWQQRYRTSVALIEQQAGGDFLALDEAHQIALLTPLSDAVDENTDKAGSLENFFRAVKSMTADGYYTSQIGLQTELGYKGNTALASFPGCTDIHEH